MLAHDRCGGSHLYPSRGRWVVTSFRATGYGLGDGGRAGLRTQLGDGRSNVRAMAVLDNTDTGTVRLVVDDPGGFAGIARILSLAGINIAYIYASALADTSTTLGTFSVLDPERALADDRGC